MIVAIEGPDGSGKSTQAKLFAARIGFQLQRFPDRSTPVGKLIDRHLKGDLALCTCEGNRQEPMYADEVDDALMFQCLMLANRMEHGRLLQTARYDFAKNVVCDRYFQSGLCYGSADGLDLKHLVEMHHLLPSASFNVLVNVPPEVCRARLDARGDKDRYEGKPGFVEDVCRRYESLWNQMMVQDDSWVIVDGTRPPESVHLAIVERYNSWKKVHER